YQRLHALRVHIRIYLPFIFCPIAPPTELYTLSLHDALPIWSLDGAGPLRTVSPTLVVRRWRGRADPASARALGRETGAGTVVFGDRKSTRLNSSHVKISYAVFCLKKKTSLHRLRRSRHQSAD